jgi:CheY-like chemotaxis protein
LIVEDIPENAEIVADLLELEDAETEHAENGKIALDMFMESPECYYDAILMDLRMPILDGLETARKLRGLDRKDARTIPIIALTANAFESDIKQTIEAGMNAHLAKPVDADAMYDALKYYISNRPDK